MRSLEELVKVPRVDLPDPGSPQLNSVAGLIDLLRSIPRPALAVEVGCYRGVSTETLLHFCDHVVAVDPWAEPWTHAAGRDFLARLGGEPRLSILKMTSLQAAGLFAGRSLDLVYLDAAHDTHSVWADIAAWWPCVRGGGCMAGHDYTPAVEGGGVIAAVNHAFPHPEVFPDTSWLVRL